MNSEGRLSVIMENLRNCIFCEQEQTFQMIQSLVLFGAWSGSKWAPSNLYTKVFYKKTNWIDVQIFIFFRWTAILIVIFHAFRSLASMTLHFPDSPHNSLTIPPACPWKSFLGHFGFEVRFCSALLTSFTLTSQRSWAQQPSRCWCLADLPFVKTKISFGLTYG